MMLDLMLLASRAVGQEASQCRSCRPSSTSLDRDVVVGGVLLTNCRPERIFWNWKNIGKMAGMTDSKNVTEHWSASSRAEKKVRKGGPSAANEAFLLPTIVKWTWECSSEVQMATTALPARHLSTTKGSCFRTCIASVSRAQLLPRRSRALLQSRQSSSSSSANVIDGAAKANYVTTPIFYVNADPHIGHLHSIVLADVLSRWAQARNRGWSSPPHAEAPTTRAIMCTGTDEHGIKIQKVAEASNVEPLALCDRVSGRFKVRLGDCT